MSRHTTLRLVVEDWRSGAYCHDSDCDRACFIDRGCGGYIAVAVTVGCRMKSMRNCSLEHDSDSMTKLYKKTTYPISVNRVSTNLQSILITYHPTTISRRVCTTPRYESDSPIQRIVAANMHGLTIDSIILSATIDKQHYPQTFELALFSSILFYLKTAKTGLGCIYIFPLHAL
jgi:hypothetical protein